MFEKIKAWFGKINETHFNVGYILLTIIVGALAVMFGFATAEILFGILIKAVTYSVSAAIFLKALMGPGVDVKKEILTENNVALAVMVAGFLAGLGFTDQSSKGKQGRH
jgi:ABC-type multidrug transport system permease subunit